MPFLFAAHIEAQTETDVHVPLSYFKGKGADISTLDFNSDGTLKDRVLIYNVGKDMFLNAGGHWGTRTVTYTVGLPIQLVRTEVTATTSSEETGSDNESTDSGSEAATYTYRLRGPFNNKEQAGSNRTGNFIGVVIDAGVATQGVFYDRGTAHAINWEFKKVDSKSVDGDVVYQICINKENNPGTDYGSQPERKLVANEKMEINVFENGNTNLVKALTDDEITDEKYSYWKIVTLQQIIEDFSTTYDTEHPSDASFLMRAQNFNRMNRYNDATKSETTDGKGWYTDGTIDYHYGLKKGVTGYVQERDEIYGMFYCGGISGGNKDGRVYQTVTIPHNGWYRIDCQGFFCNESDPETCFAQLYAKVDDKTPNTSEYAFVNLLPKSYGEPYDGAALNPDKAENKQYLASIMGNGNKEITNKIEAGVAFYNQLYPNHILIYVNSKKADDNGLIPAADRPTLELGIRLTGDVADGNYVYFDDFQLKYLGESFALNEGDDDFHAGMGDDDAYYKNRVMILKRTLTENMWNSICLPVDLTKEQLNTAFFPNPMLAKLRDSQHYGTMEFQTVDFGSLKNSDVALHKGQCYLIKPGYKGRTGNITVGNVAKTNISGPYYTIDRVTLTKADVENSLGLDATDNKQHVLKKIQDKKDVDGNDKDFYTIVGGDDEKGKIYNECKLRVYGTFERKTKINENGVTVDNRVPAHSYTFADGKLYHLSGNYTQKGFSCWIEDEHQTTGDPATANVHKLNFATYIDGVSDGTTSIEGFTVDTREAQTPAVYTIYGQQVRKGTASTEGLPHGIYVVNGKKILVR